MSDRTGQTVAHRGRRNADAVLLAELAGGATIVSAARAAGIGARTAHRRLRDADFAAALSAARADLVRAVTARLTGAALESVDVLRGLLADQDAAIRLRAATAVLGAVGRWFPLDDAAGGRAAAAADPLAALLEGTRPPPIELAGFVDEHGDDEGDDADGGGMGELVG